jgi:hypothetical protein
MYIKKINFVCRFADMMMVPVMYALQGTVKESPQRTHRWNNRKLSPEEVRKIDLNLALCMAGETGAIKRWLGIVPIFHMPIFGGWKQFVVIEPVDFYGPWHPGWLTTDTQAGVSRLQVAGPVRLTRGPDGARLFGFSATGHQVQLREVGTGIIGNAADFSQIPLL